MNLGRHRLSFVKYVTLAHMCSSLLVIMNFTRKHVSAESGYNFGPPHMKKFLDSPLVGARKCCRVNGVVSHILNHCELQGTDRYDLILTIPRKSHTYSRGYHMAARRYEISFCSPVKYFSTCCERSGGGGTIQVHVCAAVKGRVFKHFSLGWRVQKSEDFSAGRDHLHGKK